MNLRKNSSNSKPIPRKFQAYEALYLFDRSVDDIENLEGLTQLGLLREEA